MKSGRSARRGGREDRSWHEKSAFARKIREACRASRSNRGDYFWIYAHRAASRVSLSLSLSRETSADLIFSTWFPPVSSGSAISLLSLGLIDVYNVSQRTCVVSPRALLDSGEVPVVALLLRNYEIALFSPSVSHTLALFLSLSLYIYIFLFTRSFARSLSLTLSFSRDSSSQSADAPLTFSLSFEANIRKIIGRE